LLVAMQRTGTRRGTSSKQHMQLHKAKGGATFAFGYASTLCPVRISKGGNRSAGAALKAQRHHTRSAGAAEHNAQQRQQHKERQKRKQSLKQIKDNLEKGYGALVDTKDQGLTDNYPSSRQIIEALKDS
jgi:hypothetical protein